MWTKLTELLELFWLKFIVTVRELVEFLFVVIKFYSNPLFRRCDLTLLRSYLFHNPYRISKRYLLARGAEDPYLYGETPLTALEKIAERAGIQKEDIVYELGCGRGRTCFWLNIFRGCRVIGIEQIPEFVEKADYVKDKYQVPSLEFRVGDILEEDYAEATVIYLYGTNFDESFIEKLIGKLEQLKVGAKVITVSYPLTDYTDLPLFEVVDCFSCKYTWGEALVYLHVKRE